MTRKLFCEISPVTYRISEEKENLKRNIKDLFSKEKIAKRKSEELLPVVIKEHKLVMAKKISNVEQYLQENKAKNLGILAPLVTNILIYPGETFSFWSLVGRTTYKKGYREGVKITNGKLHSAIGGGMCLITHLINWLILHTDLDITEHWSHDDVDWLPDPSNQVPLGTGATISYKNIDYRFKNNTDDVYQLVIYAKDNYLHGEIRSTKEMPTRIEVREEDHYFYKKGETIYRHNKLYRKVYDQKTGNVIEDKLLSENNTKIMYDKELIDEIKIKKMF